MSYTQPAPSARAPGARIIGGEDNTSGPGPEIMAADTLEGDKIVNRQGDDLGSVEHVMIDVRRGSVAYAVMSCGGFLGMGDKRFEKAPGFDKDHWPSMADPTWASEVHAYYGARPYWDQTGSTGLGM